MYRFILKRLLMLIPVLLGVSFIVYTILSFTPGDPVQMMLGDNYSEESYAAMQEELGLDDPSCSDFKNQKSSRAQAQALELLTVIPTQVLGFDLGL